MYINNINNEFKFNCQGLISVNYMRSNNSCLHCLDVEKQSYDNTHVITQYTESRYIHLKKYFYPICVVFYDK